MKKFSKVLLTLLLVLCVACASLSISGVLSFAQAIPQGVSASFTGVDKDWVTLSGTTIQDSALMVKIDNQSDSTIVLQKIENNGINVTYTNWENNKELIPSGITNIGISGTTNNNQVLKVTVTYYVKGNPTATAETCSAYIYCTTYEGYQTATSEGYIPFNANPFSGHTMHAFGVQTFHYFYPVSTHSLSYADTDSNDRGQARNVIELYVDSSTYPTWDSLNGKLQLYNKKGGTLDSRDHAYFDKIDLEQSSDTGSFIVGGYGVSGSTKTLSSEFNNDQDNPSGFYFEAGNDLTVDIGITGTIPSEATSTVTLKLREFGQTGVTGQKTVEMNPQWDITIYNNNKTELRELLQQHAGYGLNQASYKSGWDAYETALKNAYTVLGTNDVTASQVSSAVTSLNNAYNALVRYAVVITNHYFYEGGNDQNPVQFAKKYEMQVTNGASHSLEVLTNGTYPDYAFNRTNVTAQKLIQVGEDTNYTETVNQYYWYVDTSALEAAIATQAAKVHVDEDNNPIYTDDSWQAYEAEAAKAVTVLNDKSLFQADIDAETKALNDAEKALVKLDIDIEWLTEGIAWADQIINSSYDDDFGYGWQTEELFASEYAQERYTAFNQAYNDAVEVTNDPNYTKAQADRVCAALWQAIGDLRTVDETTKGLLRVGGVRHADIDQYGYYKGIQDQHTEATGLRVVYNDILDNTSGTYRLNETDFTEDSWAMLQDALYGDFAQGSYFCAATMEPYAVDSDAGELSVPAYSMINNIWFLASQADYNACRDNLIDKVNNLEWIVGDYSELEALLEQAHGFDSALYTANSYAGLQTAMDICDAAVEKLTEPQLYGDPDAITDSVIEQRIEELRAAIDALVLKPYLTATVEHIRFAGESGSVIYGESYGCTAEQALQHLNIEHNTEDVVIAVYPMGSDTPCALVDRIGTAYTVVLSGVDGEIYETHTYVIAGDVIGDAQITDSDFALVYDYAFNEDSLEGLYLEAADVNGDGLVDLTDAILIQNIIYA